MELPKNITKISHIIKKWRKRKGFKTPLNIHGKNADDMLGKLMLVVTEVSEAAEAVRNDDVENFREEIADSIIRLLDIASTTGMDIHYEIKKKMEINKQREYKHGKKTSL